MLEMGSRVKDKITGFVGVITARTEYLHGCDILFVEPRCSGFTGHEDSKSIKGQWFDTPRLETHPEGA